MHVPAPEYSIERVGGADHKPLFRATCTWIPHRITRTGHGNSKVEAKRAASIAVIGILDAPETAPNLITTALFVYEDRVPSSTVRAKLSTTEEHRVAKRAVDSREKSVVSEPALNREGECGLVQQTNERQHSFAARTILLPLECKPEDVHEKIVNESSAPRSAPSSQDDPCSASSPRTPTATGCQKKHSPQLVSASLDETDESLQVRVLTPELSTVPNVNGSAPAAPIVPSVCRESVAHDSSKSCDKEPLDAPFEEQPEEHSRKQSTEPSTGHTEEVVDRKLDQALPSVAQHALSPSPRCEIEQVTEVREGRSSSPICKPCGSIRSLSASKSSAKMETRFARVSSYSAGSEMMIEENTAIISDDLPPKKKRVSDRMTAMSSLRESTPPETNVSTDESAVQDKLHSIVQSPSGNLTGVNEGHVLPRKRFRQSTTDNACGRLVILFLNVADMEAMSAVASLAGSSAADTLDLQVRAFGALQNDVWDANGNVPTWMKVTQIPSKYGENTVDIALAFAAGRDASSVESSGGRVVIVTTNTHFSVLRSPSLVHTVRPAEVAEYLMNFST